MSNCINYKHPDVAKIAGELNISPVVAAAKIGLWQSKNNIEDRFPTVEELIPVQEIITENKVVKKIKKSLLDFVNYTEDKVNSLKKDYSSEHNRILFNNKQGKITVDQILENILNNFNDLTPIGKDLIQKARRLVDKNGAKFKFVSDEQLTAKDTLMQIDGNTNTIQISRDRIKNFNPKIIVESFLHELAHAQSIQALINPQTFEEKEFKKLIDEYYFKYFNKQVEKQLFKTGNHDPELQSYGFKNEKEFVAEIYANPKFRDELRTLDKENHTSFWKNFIEHVRRLFGLAKSKDANLLIEQVIDFVEADRRDYQGMSSQKQLIFEKEIEQPKNIELDTLDKHLQNTIDKSKDRIEQLLKRTVSSKNIKNKEDHDKFIKGFTDLLEEVETLEKDNKWKAITSYVTSFAKTAFSLKNKLDDLLYDENTDTFTKNIDTEDMLETVDRYNEYLSAYDLLDDIENLIKRSQNDITSTKSIREGVKEIKTLLSSLKENTEDLKAHFLNVRRSYFIKEFSKPENNIKVVTQFKNKLFTEYKSLNIKSETKEEYFGRMIQTKYKDEYEKALLDNAKKVVYDPSFDITSAERIGTDLLNINSSIINLVANTIGKMRDNIISQYQDSQFKFVKLFDKYSKEKGQNNQSKMYENLIELSQNDEYYLKGDYSIEFLNAVQNKLYPILDQRTQLIQKLTDEGLTKYQIKKHPEIKALGRNIASWFNEHTVKVNDETRPKAKYKNKELTGVEKELSDYFKQQTEDNDKDSYDGNISLIKNVFGAKFYKIPSVTKTNLERTLEGDIKGQLKDKWTDLTQIKVDDVNYGEAVDSNNKERRNVKIGYRGKITSKDQSLDLATVYRKEALNAINYKEKKSNEIKLKLFLEIAREKDYKKQSIGTGKWLQNKFAKNSPGVTFKGEHSQELKKIEGLLETHLYDVLSYSGGKVLGTNMEASKLSSTVNGFAASIAMTANIGSGAVNVLNGLTQMIIESVGGTHFNKTDLLKAEANYNKNIMYILADLNNPIKQSFHNQMLDMFDIFGGFDTATQEFIRNSYAKKLISTHSLNGLNEMGEHMMNTVLTESILRGLKVMNSERKFIDKEGNVVEESKAASLFDMLSLNDNGKLVMSDKVIYTNKNLDSKYHEGGKQHINYVIKKKGHDIFGVYDPLMKAELAKHWWGKTVMMFKNFFMSAFKHRYKGFQTSLKSKDELTEDDLSFNNAEQEFTEGIYTSFIRFISQGVYPSLKGLQIAYMKDYYNSLTEYEKSNLKKTTLEIGTTMVILPLLGMLLGAAAGDDDDEIYFALYAFRRLESELSQFRDPRELNRMIQNPIAANRFIQNSLTVISDIITPLNFNPQRNEVFFDYFSEDAKHNNITLKHVKKITPFYNQLDKQYKNLYTLLDK